MFRSNMAIIRPIIQNSLKILYKIVLKAIDNGDLNSTFTPVRTCYSVKFTLIFTGMITETIIGLINCRTQLSGG